MIRIIAIGKKHDAWIKDGLERYQKRLRSPFDVQWMLLPYSEKNGVEARENESKNILRHIKSSEYVILLDERGRSMSSVEFSQYLERISVQKPIAIIIGGAYGVDDSVTQRADNVISLSNMVFPHMLVRLILIEQLYRAQEIARGGPYHHK